MKRLALLTVTASLLAGCGLFAADDPGPLVTTLDFGAYNAQAASLRQSGVRVFGKNATVAQDFEPEYVTVAPGGRTAYVTLQENNALAVLDLVERRVTSVVPLGFKNHALAGNGLDPSDRDGISVRPVPVFGMYQPDAIAAFEVGGETFLISANEGDARDYNPGLQEEVRASTLRLDAAAFPNAGALQTDASLGRLSVTNQLGDLDGDGDFDRLYAFGARSISVWNAAGSLVYDSGDLLEQRTAVQVAAHFNASNDNNSPDNRSDNKGPEPEGVVIGTVGSQPFAFVGLERIGGVAVFDLSNPRAPVFVGHFNNRDFSQPVTIGTGAAQQANPAAKDLGPEGLAFVSAAQSPTGQPLLIVANEVSGTTTLYSVATTATPGALTVLGTYRPPVVAAGVGAAEIPAFDPVSKRVFVINNGTRSVDILDVSNPAAPTLVRSVDLGAVGAPNSVAVSALGVIAVAVENNDKQRGGNVVFLSADGAERARVEVGALPDMLTFTPDGRFVLTANEGEPNADYSVDPVGSVSMINVSLALRNR